MKSVKKPKKLRPGCPGQWTRLFAYTVAFWGLLTLTNVFRGKYSIEKPLRQDGPLESIEQIDPMGYMAKLSETTFSPGRSMPPTVYSNLPVSRYRPSGQFMTDPAHVLAPPVITVLTVTYNPRHFIFRVARFVLEQSLQAFRWIIVNDHTDDPVALQRLEELRKLADRDWRVRIIENKGPRGGPSAMNFGMQYVRTPYVAILDDDDLWELTALEKAALVMSWVPSAHAVGFDVINHGAKEFVWTRGFHNGDVNFYFENGLVQGSPLRTAVFDKCKFSTDFSGGAADWDLWMCMASKGMWGMHVPENGTWYQVNPASFRKKRWANLASAGNLADTHTRIMKKYEKMLKNDAAWHMILPEPFNASHVEWGPAPFENRVAPTASKRLMIILTSFQRTAPVLEMLRYVQSLAEDGWRTTILAAHYRAPDDGTKDLFMQYTHDVFVAPLVSPVSNMVKLVTYLIESRRINTVIVGQSKFGYAVLPAIAMFAPEVKLIDYVSQCNATNDLIARESVKMDRYLDLTIVPTAQAYRCLTDRGKPQDKAVVTRAVDVEFCKCGLIGQDGRRAGKQKLGLVADQMLIAVAPLGDNVTSVWLMESLVAVLRDRMLRDKTATDDGVRMYWPSAPLSNVSSADPIARSWLTLPEQESDAWALADLVIVVGSTRPYLNPDMFGCRGAIVLTDVSRLADEPAWEWGRSVILRAPPLTSNAQITQYARYIDEALRKAAATNTNNNAFEPGSQDAGTLLEQGRVVCPCKEALRRAHESKRRSAILDNDGSEIKRTLARAVVDESTKWPSVFDMHSIQTRLQFQKSRTGFGRMLQRQCPERIYQNTEWIDALESVKGCDGEVIDGKTLTHAARTQCGAWCIANVGSSYPKPRGWSLQGVCWRNVVSSEHPCMGHITNVLSSRGIGLV